MKKPHSHSRRWLEVALTSFVAALTVWDSFPEGTATARILRAAIAAAVGPVLIYLRHGRAPRTSAPSLTTSAGFVRTGTLFLLAAVALGAACATQSSSSGSTRTSTNATLDDSRHEDTKATAEEAAQEKRHEEPTVTDDEVKVEIAATPSSPAKTITRKRRTTTGAVDTSRDSEKHAAVEKALQDDAKALLAGDSEGATQSDKSFKPSMSCAMGGTLGLVLAGLAAFLLFRRSKLAKAAKALGAPIP